MDVHDVENIRQSLQRYLACQLYSANVDVGYLVDRYIETELPRAVESAAAERFKRHVQDVWGISGQLASYVWEYWKATEMIKLDKYYSVLQKYNVVTNVALFNSFKLESIHPTGWPDTQQHILLPKVRAWKEENAAKVIQHAWHRAINNPAYRLCKTRLMSEFDLLFD